MRTYGLGGTLPDRPVGDSRGLRARIHAPLDHATSFPGSVARTELYQGLDQPPYSEHK